MTTPLKRSSQLVIFLILVLVIYSSYHYYAGELKYDDDNWTNGSNQPQSSLVVLEQGKENSNNNDLLKNKSPQRKGDSIMNRFLNQCWTCSNKLKHYVAFHKSVTSRKDFPSYLYENNTENHQVIIYRSPRKKYTRKPIMGIADHFAAMMTLFSVCVATNTICLVDWPELEWALERSEFFDSVLFVRTGAISRNFNETIDYMTRSYQSPNHFLHPFYSANVLNRMLSCLKDPTLGKAFGNVYITHGYWGGIYSLLYEIKDQTYQNALLREGNLKPQHIYGCMFNMLFALKVNQAGLHIKTLYEQTMEAEKKNLTKVSLQIRLGDKALREQELRAFRTEEVKDFPLQFFECALALEEINQLPKNSKWILMSDTHQLVLWAKEKYQSRLIYNPNKAVHTSGDFGEVNRQGFVDAIAEFWVSGYGNYFIITEQSGLGRQAAFRSLNVDGNVYVFSTIRTEKREGLRWCLQNVNTWQALAVQYSKI